MKGQDFTQRSKDPETLSCPSASRLPGSPVLSNILRQIVTAPIQGEILNAELHAPVHAAMPTTVAASPVESPRTASSKSKPLGEILSEAGRKALGGGIPGMAAMATQVSCQLLVSVVCPVDACAFLLTQQPMELNPCFIHKKTDKCESASPWAESRGSSSETDFFLMVASPS